MSARLTEQFQMVCGDAEEVINVAFGPAASGQLNDWS